MNAQSDQTPPVPPVPPAGLLKAMSGKAPRVIPFIGSGVSIALGFPSGAQLARGLLERAEAARPELRQLWVDARAKIDTGAIDPGAEDIRKNVDKDSYLIWLRDDLKKWTPEPSQAHTLLDLLNFRVYLTTNYDRVLESTLYPPPEVLTYEEFEDALWMMKRGERLIMKLHGDISRISTVLHGTPNEEAHDAHAPVEAPQLGTVVPTEGKDMPEPLAARGAAGREDFLKAVFGENSVLFLGVSFTDENEYSDIMETVQAARIEKNGGQAPAPQHFALLDYRNITAKVLNQLNAAGVMPLPYDPTGNHSQIWQFLAQLRDDDNYLPRHGEAQGAFFSASRRPRYLRQQATHEENAHALRFLTPRITNALTPPAFLEEDARSTLPEFYKDLPPDLYPKLPREKAHEKWRDEVISEMQNRRLILDQKIGEGQEIRILAEVDITRAQAGPKASQALIDRMHWIIELLERQDLDVELRLTKRVFKDEHVASFGLAMTPHGEGTDTSVFYAAQATNAAFNVHVVQHNTLFARSRLRIFEEEWVHAYSERISLQILKELYPTGRKSLLPPLILGAATS